MYILTTTDGGCVVDAVSQISAGDNPLIAVSVMKQNYTNSLMKKSEKFALSILKKETDGSIIKTFGLQSMKDIDKFKDVETIEIEDIKVISDSLGYTICEIIDTIDNDTHTLFIGRLTEADVFAEEEAMSYEYYQQHKEELLKVTTEQGKSAWICSVCGYVYYGKKLPDDFKCPKCGVSRELFKKVKK